MLQRISSALMFLYFSAIRNPRRTLLAGACLFGVSLAGLPHLRSLLKIEEIIDPDSKQARILQKLNEDFAIGNVSSLIFSTRSGAPVSPDAMCEVRDWIAQVKLELPDLLHAQSSFELRQVRFDGERLTYPLILSLDCSLRGSPQNLTRAHPPTGGEDLARLGYGGIFTTRTSSAQPQDLLLQLHFAPGPKSGSFGTFVPAQIFELRTRIGQLLERLPELEVHPFGEADFQHEVLSGIQADLRVYALLGLVLIVLLRVGVGTWRAGLLFVSTVIVTTFLTYGLMGWLGHPLDLLTNCLFPMIAVAALEDFVFIAHDRTRRSHSAALLSFEELAVPSFFTSLTTAIGFFSLCVADEPIITRFGLWAGVAACIEYAVTFWILPAAMTLWPKLKDFADPKRAMLPAWFNALERKAPSRTLARVLLLVFVAAPFAIAKLAVHDSPLHLFPESSPVRTAAQYAESTRGWQSSTDVVFDPSVSPDQRLEVLRKVKADPDVVAILSPELMLETMTQGLPPLTRELVYREAHQTPSFRHLISENGTSRSTLYLQSADSSRVRELRERVDAYCPGNSCSLAGGLIAYQDFIENVPRILLESFGLSLILVLGIVLFLARSTGRGNHFALVLSCLWGPAVMLAVMGFGQIPINMMTCMFASVLIGLTGDNAIQFILSRDSLERGIEARAGGTILCGTMMAAGSLAFVFSSFDPPRLFGLLLSVGMLVSMFGDLWVLKGLTRG